MCSWRFGLTAGVLAVAACAMGAKAPAARAQAPNVGQITFTTQNSNTGEYTLWRIAAQQGATPDNLTTRLNAVARFPGVHAGPISVSPDGNFYVFDSSRFSADAAGNPCLTIASADFSAVETVHTPSGIVNNEGLAEAAAGGNAIVFETGGGPVHTRDLFLIQRQAGGGWSDPKLLTSDSPNDFNFWPVLSADSTRVVFEAGADPYIGTRICEVGLDGTGFRTLLTRTDVPAGNTPSTEAHSPAYAPDGSLVLEMDAATSGNDERIWRLPLGAQVPALVNGSDTNDNSPVVLPDGRIGSLWLGGSGADSGMHELKIMNPDGSGGFLLTHNAGSFTEIADVGMGAGPMPGGSPPPVPGKMGVSPRTITFPSVKRGKTRTTPLHVTNKGKGTLHGTVGTLQAPFSIDKPGDFSLPPGTPKKPSTLTLHVTFAPTSKGQQSQTFQITGDDPTLPSVSVRVRGRGL